MTGVTTGELPGPAAGALDVFVLKLDRAGGFALARSPYVVLLEGE